jgi:hypothetical protein
MITSHLTHRRKTMSLLKLALAKRLGASREELQRVKVSEIKTDKEIPKIIRRSNSFIDNRKNDYRLSKR